MLLIGCMYVTNCKEYMEGFGHLRALFLPSQWFAGNLRGSYHVNLLVPESRLEEVNNEAFLMFLDGY